MTKRFGFTLAEVLITLGIIGVVAAMTIPTLISNTNGAQFKSAYKKALSTLNQAIVMNIALEDYDFSTLLADEEGNGTGTRAMSTILSQRLQSATNITDDYFASAGSTIGALKYGAKKCTTQEAQADAGKNPQGPCAGKADQEITAADFSPTSGNSYVYSFADGTAFGYSDQAENCTSAGTADCVGWIDVNGATTPNMQIACDDGSYSGCPTVSSANIRDIYPVYFHGQTVEPANDAARAVLFGK